MKHIIFLQLFLFTLMANEYTLTVLDEVEVSGELRPRYEVANDGVNKIANAFTTRLNLGLETKKLFSIENLSALIEFNGNINLSLDPYNSLENGKVDYTIIADPAGTRISKLQLKYLWNKTELLAGREAVNLDNERFIGSDNFRQQYQSFDLLSVQDKTLENLELYAAFLARQQAVASSQAFNEALIFNMAYSLAAPMKLVGYTYLINQHSDTYGLSASGVFKTDDMSLKYRIEGAKQVNPTLSTRLQNVDSLYYTFDMKLDYLGFFAGIEYEVLGGGTNATDASFATPYASLHSFNGDADIFLTTPQGGLIDVHSQLGFHSDNLGKFKGDYHFYSSEKVMTNFYGNDSTNLGSEFDLSYEKDIDSVKGLSALIQAAFYFSGTIVQGGQDYTNNVQKVWLQLDYKFLL